MQDLMMLYGVTLGCRFNKKQKNLFYQTLCSEAKVRQLPISIFGSKKTNNIIIGDLKNSDYLLVTGYDTPVSTQANYYPFNSVLTMQKWQKPLLIRIIILTLLLISYGVCILGLNNTNQSFKIFITILVLASSIITYYFTRPRANPVNFNKNSSAIALMIKLIQTINNNKMISYVFLDNTCQSHESLRQLKTIINNQQIVIQLDGIAYGEELLIAYHHQKGNLGLQLFSQNKQLFDRQRSYNDKDNVVTYFEESIYLSSGKIIDKQFCVPNVGTKQDYQLNLERLEKIYEMLFKLLTKGAENK